MHDRITNIIAIAKHRKVLARTELICRYIRMKHHISLTKYEIRCRVAFLKDTCMFDLL
jgi:hypothetical protein